MDAQAQQASENGKTRLVTRTEVLAANVVFRVSSRGGS